MVKKRPFWQADGGGLLIDDEYAALLWKLFASDRLLNNPNGYPIELQSNQVIKDKAKIDKK